jgi:hypothetical protein
MVSYGDFYFMEKKKNGPIEFLNCKKNAPPAPNIMASKNLGVA